METKRLVGIIKEAAQKQQMGYLINYQPPGCPIIINPVVDNTMNTPDGIKPLANGPK